MDFDWMKLAQGAFVVMMLFAMWPAYKWWSKNSPKAENGDWGAALIALAAVVGFVVLLVMSMR